MVDRKNNVEVLSLMPGFVATNMTKRIKSQTCKGFSKVEDCVSGCLRDLSYESETYGTATHEIIGTLAEFLIKFTLLSPVNEKKIT